jgi:hypothetical protein
MQAITTPQITKMETDTQATWIIGNYRIHVLPVQCSDYPEATHKLVVTLRGELNNEPEWDTFESFAEAMELAAEWVEIAIEDETEWEDE